MLFKCCSQERTYLRNYGLLGQRFCMINKVYQENFDKCFVQQYSMIHRLETNKLRNVAKFFAHLPRTDALPWHVLAYIRLTEEDTTSSWNNFIKILFHVQKRHQFFSLQFWFLPSISSGSCCIHCCVVSVAGIVRASGHPSAE